MNEPIKVDKILAFVPILMVAVFFFFGGYIGVAVTCLVLLVVANLLYKGDFGSASQLKEIAYAQLSYSLYAIVPNSIIVIWVRSQPESLMTESLMITGIYIIWSVVFMNLVLCVWSAIAISWYQKFWKFPLLIRFDNFPHKREDAEKLNLK